MPKPQGEIGSMYDFTFEADKSIYPLAAILKAAYAFVGRAYVHLGDNGSTWSVSLTSKSGSSGEIAAKEFENELLAQTVRLSVFQQTHTIRELLLARALSSTMVEDSASAPEDVEEDISQEDLEQILTDWFEK